jgi:signal transduction histidine kinase
LRNAPSFHKTLSDAVVEVFHALSTVIHVAHLCFPRTLDSGGVQSALSRFCTEGKYAEPVEANQLAPALTPTEDPHLLTEW